MRSGRFGFGLTRVEAQLEQHAQALADVPVDGLEDTVAGEHLHGVLAMAPPVATLVALGLAERPEPLHGPAP